MVLHVQTPTNFSVKPLNYRTVKVQWTKEQLKEAFKCYDLNGDGKLSKEELRQAFKGLGSTCGTIRAWKALSHADADNSGYVELTDKEFEELVDYAFKRGYKISSECVT